MVDKAGWWQLCWMFRKNAAFLSFLEHALLPGGQPKTPHRCFRNYLQPYRQCLNVSTARMCALTYEARRGRIGLDVLLSVALDHIPEPPHVAGVKDVEGLVRMGPPVLHVRAEQVVVGTGVPLRQNTHPFQSPFPCQMSNWVKKDSQEFPLVACKYR